MGNSAFGISDSRDRDGWCFICLWIVKLVGIYCCYNEKSLSSLKSSWHDTGYGLVELLLHPCCCALKVFLDFKKQVIWFWNQIGETHLLDLQFARMFRMSCMLNFIWLNWFVYWSPLGFLINIATLMEKLTVLRISSVFIVLIFANKPAGITANLLGKQDCPNRKGYGWRGELCSGHVWNSAETGPWTVLSSMGDGAVSSLIQPERCVTWPHIACFTTSWENWLQDVSLISMLRSSNLLLSGAEVGRLPPRLKVDLNVLLRKLQQWWKQVRAAAGSLLADAIRLTLTCISREG